MFHSIDDLTTWERRYLDLCDHISQWSRDPSSQFGCVLIDQRNKPLGFGTNGFASGFNDTPDRWNDREFKYRHVIHAEENAILNSNGSLLNSRAFVNGCPCSSCMSKLAQVGVNEVIAWAPTKDYLKRWSVDEPKQVALECGIKLSFVNRPS